MQPLKRLRSKIDNVFLNINQEEYKSAKQFELSLLECLFSIPVDCHRKFGGCVFLTVFAFIFLMQNQFSFLGFVDASLYGRFLLYFLVVPLQTILVLFPPLGFLHYGLG